MEHEHKNESYRVKVSNAIYSLVTLTEQEKLAAVDRAVPTTLPLSFIPSKNELIMMALTPIMHIKQIPRVASETEGQTHDIPSSYWSMLAMQMECTVDGTGESGERASLAMNDAVAPRAPLRMAPLLMDIFAFASPPRDGHYSAA